MGSVTVWPARVSGLRLLCGRQVAGRYVCQGEMATVTFAMMGKARIRMPPGIVRGWSIIGDRSNPDDPLLGIDHVRLTSRAERQAAVGRAAIGHGAAGDDMVKRRRFPEWATIETTVTRECPHCGAVGLLDPKVLSGIAPEDAPAL